MRQFLLCELGLRFGDLCYFRPFGRRESNRGHADCFGSAVNNGLTVAGAWPLTGLPGFPYIPLKGKCDMSSTVTAAQVSKNFGAYQHAAVREPVIITRNGRPRTVLLAYEDLMRLSKRDRRVQLTVDLTEAEISAIEASV